MRSVTSRTNVFKSTANGSINWFIIFSNITFTCTLFSDPDDERRSRVRDTIKHDALEAQNKFDVQGRIDGYPHDLQLQMALLTPAGAERAAKKAVWVTIIVGPERRHFWRENTARVRRRERRGAEVGG